MWSTKTILTVIALLIASTEAQSNKPLTAAPIAPKAPKVPVPANTGAIAVAFNTNAECANARDATIAGIATAHQLLAQALIKTPIASKATVNDIKKAQTGVNKAFGLVGNLANSAVKKANPKAADLKAVNAALNTALISVKLAVKSEAAPKAAPKGKGTTNKAVAASQQIAVITVDGPTIVNQPAAVLSASPPSGLLNQAELQLQSALKAVSKSSACLSTKATVPKPLNGTLPITNTTAPHAHKPLNGTALPLNVTVAINVPSANTPPKSAPIDVPTASNGAPKSAVSAAAAVTVPIPKGQLRPFPSRPFVPWSPIRGGFGWGFRGARNA